MATDHAFVVQFPHPGAEHNPGRAEQMDWNSRPHKRKFLRSPGRYTVEPGGAERTDELVFWGEWEAQSTVVQRWTDDAPGLPRFQHIPWWRRPLDDGFRQNTDPWVFGERFRYSNCKQLTPHGRRSALQRLTPGSLVLFGSQVDGAFVLDTALVVASTVLYTPASGASLSVGKAFQTCTIGSLLTDRTEKLDVPNAPLSLVSGATPADPIAGMHSFAPARLAEEGNARFARPVIQLDGLINPASRQAALGANRSLPLGQVVDAWRSVAEQVLAADCLLGTSFATPEERP